MVFVKRRAAYTGSSFCYNPFLHSAFFTWLQRVSAKVRAAVNQNFSVKFCAYTKRNNDMKEP